MKIQSRGLQIIKEFESLKLKPYLCPAGIPTIGYGSTYYEDGTKVTLNDLPITEQRADELLANISDKFSIQVSKLLKVELNQNQFDALVSFSFNIGIGNLTTSTILKKINEKDFENASLEFAKWNKSGGKVLNGLITRREKERQLFTLNVKKI